MMQPAKPFLMLWIWGSLLGTSLLGLEHGTESNIRWSEDLAATLKIARQTGKPVLVHFYGDNCPPCRMLERKAFRDPQLIQAIHSKVLAVRINAEKDTKTAAKYRVNRWPTDLYLYPDGQEIYRNISAQDPSAYEKTVLKVAEKNQKMLAQHRSKGTEPTRAELVAAQNDGAISHAGSSIVLASGKTDVQQTQTVPEAKLPVRVSLNGPAVVRLSENSVLGVDTAEVAVERSPVLPMDSLKANQELQSRVVEVPLPSLVDHPASSAPSAKLAIQTSEPVLPSKIAMGGFCPVSLSMAIDGSKSGSGQETAWVRGHDEFAVRHRGRVYHCASQELRDQFLQQPDHYAPVFSGCDLVEYSKSGKWIDGDCRFGFIDKETGRIFLFSSSMNCQEFAQNCESYSSMVGKDSGR